MTLTQIVALIVNLGVATTYSLVLLYWVITKLSKVLDDMSKALRAIKKDLDDLHEERKKDREDIKNEIREVKTLLYMKGGEKREMAP